VLRTLAEWTWRLAILAAVLWVGWEVALLREDVLDAVDPAEEPAAAVASPTPSAPAVLVPDRSDRGIKA
jgi:hypothetical protein